MHKPVLKNPLRGGIEGIFFRNLAAGYLLLGIVFVYFYRFQLNTDGFGYLSIAQKYADGNFGPAVNGFWSPMYSWLAAVPIAAGLPAMIAAKIVGLLAGLALLFAVKKLLCCFDLEQFTRKAVLAALVPISVYCAVSLTTPDLLAAVFVVYYLGLIFDRDYPVKNYGLWCGILGGMAYLAKTYAFLFFGAHFLLFSMILFWRSNLPAEKKNIVRNFIVGIAAFAAVSGSWIAVISAKYGEFTIGRTGTYNLAAYGPGASGDPLDYLGFLPPADRYSLSAWDDPGLIDIPAAKETTMAQKLSHYSRNTVENAVKTFVVIYSRFSLLALAAFVFSIIVILKRASKRIFARDHIYIVLTILAVQSGYLPIHIEERYIWAAHVLLLILAVKIVQDLFYSSRNEKIKKIMICFAAFSFALAPVYKLISRIDTGKEYGVAHERLEGSGIGGRIASSAKWSESLVLAFYAGGQYYGIPKPGIGQDELASQLAEYGVDYYIFWHDSGVLPDFLKNKEDVSGGKNPNMSVYLLK